MTTEVPIFIVKTDKGLIANNVGPGIQITPSGCECVSCRYIKKQWKQWRDEALSQLK